MAILKEYALSTDYGLKTSYMVGVKPNIRRWPIRYRKQLSIAAEKVKKVSDNSSAILTKIRDKYKYKKDNSTAYEWPALAAENILTYMSQNK
jgi:uncharacterized protein (DUF342 family)